MGWFEKQIQQREDLDQQLFEDSFVRVAGIVLGHATAAKISEALREHGTYKRRGPSQNPLKRTETRYQ